MVAVGKSVRPKQGRLLVQPVGQVIHPVDMRVTADHLLVVTPGRAAGRRSARQRHPFAMRQVAHLVESMLPATEQVDPVAGGSMAARVARLERLAATGRQVLW